MVEESIALIIHLEKVGSLDNEVKDVRARLVFGSCEQLSAKFNCEIETQDKLVFKLCYEQLQVRLRSKLNES